MMEKLAGLGYAVASGAEISPERREPERRSFHEAILRKVFEEAVRRLNPGLPDGAALRDEREHGLQMAA